MLAAFLAYHTRLAAGEPHTAEVLMAVVEVVEAAEQQERSPYYKWLSQNFGHNQQVEQESAVEASENSQAEEEQLGRIGQESEAVVVVADNPDWVHHNWNKEMAEEAVVGTRSLLEVQTRSTMGKPVNEECVRSEVCYSINLHVS